MTASSPGRFYRPELDALRLVAFLMVFCRHVAVDFGLAKVKGSITPQFKFAAQDALAALPSQSPALSHGWATAKDYAQLFDFGVCLFFFLSSFLITKLLLIEHERTQTVAIGQFYIRRALRIWPLYFGFVILCGLLGFWMSELHTPASRVLAALLFVLNWVIVRRGWVGGPVELLWSVCVEEQFYLIWPTFARKGRTGVIFISLLIGAASICTLALLGARQHTVTTNLWPNSLVQCLFFAGGALLAVYGRDWNRASASRVLLLVTGFICWMVAAGVCHIVRIASPGAISLVTGYLLVLLGSWMLVEAFLGLPAKFLPSFSVYLGKISYGLYVYHVLCLILVHQIFQHLFSERHHLLLFHTISAIVALAATVLLAHLSYQFFEKPFLALKQRFTVIRSRPD